MDSGEVIDFSVQLSLIREGELHEVIRYDSAHGTVHVHKFWRAKTQREDLRLGEKGKGLTFAVDDLQENWDSYLDLFEQHRQGNKL